MSSDLIVLKELPDSHGDAMNEVDSLVKVGNSLHGARPGPAHRTMADNDTNMPTSPQSTTTNTARLYRGWSIGIALVTLCAVAFLVRVYRIGYDPVWFDEAATIGIAMLPFKLLFGEMARLESSPAGYYVIAKIWGGLFGLEAIPLRLLSAIAGAVAIIPIWLITRDISGARSAWLAAGMLALAATHVRLSQDARTYALLFVPASFGLLLAIRLGLHGAMDRVAVRYVLLLGLMQGSMLWLHSTTPFILLGLNACLFVTASFSLLGPRNAVVLVIGANVVTGVVGFVPIIHAITHLLQPQFADRWIDEPDVIETFRLYGRALVGPFLHGVSHVAGGVYAVLVTFAAFFALRSRNAALFGVLAMLVVSGLALPLVSNLVPILLDRTVLFLLTSLLVLVASATAPLPRPAFLAVGGLLLVLQTMGVVNYQTIAIRKEQWPAVAAALHGRVGDDAAIVVTEGAFAAIALQIPMRALGDEPRVITAPPTAVMEQFAAAHLARVPLLDPSALCSVLNGATEVWVVTRGLPDIVADDPGYSSRSRIVEVLRSAGATRSPTPPRVDHFLIDQWSRPNCG